MKKRGIGLYLLLVVIILGLSAYIVYDKVFSNDKVSKVPADDLYSIVPISYDIGEGEVNKYRYLMIYDGNLYQVESNLQTIASAGQQHNDKTLTKTTPVEGRISRLKTYYIGSDETPTHLFIMEDGRVTENISTPIGSEVDGSFAKLFKDYKVEDIMSVVEVEPGQGEEDRVTGPWEFTLLLKDGKTTKVKY